ncbi:putative ribonuclease H-like domain-containing protein [Tanacetum coccineum]
MELNLRIELCLIFMGNMGIKQEYSNGRTPQQNGVAERMNRTLIEAARTMLADSLLPTTFWAEAVSTACFSFIGYQVYQGRLLASFQDDAKYEHVGQDTRSQGGKDDQDGRIKI